MPKLDFPGQHSDEEVLFVFRKHIIAMRKGFYGLLIPFCLGSVPFLIWQSNVDLLWGPLIGFALGLFIFFYHWMCWYFSVYIVTNERIRQSSQTGLFGRSVIDLGLAKIQNISYNIPWFFGEIFHFGTIVIQTFVGDLVIRNVEHPGDTYNKLQNAVTDAIEKQEEHEETSAVAG